MYESLLVSFTFYFLCLSALHLPLPTSEEDCFLSPFPQPWKEKKEQKGVEGRRLDTELHGSVHRVGPFWGLEVLIICGLWASEV